MGTKVDDYQAWTAAAVLYGIAEQAERLARVRRTVAAALRRLGGAVDRSWPLQRADELAREADRNSRYARVFRARAVRLSGFEPWRAGRQVPAR